MVAVSYILAGIPLVEDYRFVVYNAIIKIPHLLTEDTLEANTHSSIYEVERLKRKEALPFYTSDIQRSILNLLAL